MKRLALAVYVVCFGIGALSHARDFLARGWPPYVDGPLAFRGFWTALLPLDLGVVALLWLGRRRPGLLLALAIMVLDVSVNVTHSLMRYRGWFPGGVPLQAAVLGFVLGSFGFLWPKDDGASPRAARTG